MAYNGPVWDSYRSAMDRRFSNESKEVKTAWLDDVLSELEGFYYEIFKVCSAPAVFKHLKKSDPEIYYFYKKSARDFSEHISAFAKFLENEIMELDLEDKGPVI